jgi:hypothetical protein
MRNPGDSTNRKIILAIIITVVVIGAIIGGYFLYKNYDNKRLNEVFSLGYNKSLQDVAQGQTQTGSILIWNAQNSSIMIRSIQDICGGLASTSA